MLDKPEEICPIYGMTSRLSTVQAAKAIGIDVTTLHRWIRRGVVRPPRAVLRNGRGVRLWSAADVKRLRKFKERTYWQGRGGRKKKA